MRRVRGSVHVSWTVALVAAAGCEPAKNEFVTRAEIVQAGGSGGGGPAALAVTRSARSPGDGLINPGSSGAILAFRIDETTGAGVVLVESLRFRAAGSADDAAAVASLRLAVDADGDGAVGPADAYFAQAPRPLQDDGAVSFGGLREPVIKALPLDLLLVLETRSGVAGETLLFDLEAVRALDQATGAAVTATGLPIRSATLAFPPGRIRLEGVGQGSWGTFNRHVADFGVLRFTLREENGTEGALVSSISLTGAGSGNDAAAVARATLHRDANDSKEYDGAGTDPQVGTDARYGADDGTVVFGGLSEVLPAGGERTYFVVYDLDPSGAARAGDTFGASIATPTAVEAVGDVAGTRLAVAGAPLAGPILAAEEDVGHVRVSLWNGGPAPPLRRRYRDVVILGFDLGEDTDREDALVTSIAFKASGTGDDAAAVTRVALFRDADNTRDYDPGWDVRIGAEARFSADDGTAVFSGLAERLTGGGDVSYMLLYDMDPGGAARPGETFAASIATPSAIEATGTTFGERLGVGGTPALGPEATAVSNLWPTSDAEVDVVARLWGWWRAGLASTGEPVLFWRQSASAFRIQRVDRLGDPVWGWKHQWDDPTGAEVAASAGSRTWERDQAAAVTGGDEAVLAWRTDAGDVRGQRVDLETAASLWSPAPALAGGAAEQGNPRVVADGAGGAFLLYEDDSGIPAGLLATRIDAAGLPAWPAPAALSAQFRGPGGWPPVAGMAVLPGGDAIAAFLEWGVGMRVQRMAASDGGPLWGAAGAPVPGCSSYAREVGLAGDGLDGALVVWTAEDPISGEDIFAQHVSGTAIIPSTWPNAVTVAAGVALAWEEPPRLQVAVAGSGAYAVVAWRTGGVRAQAVDLATGQLLWGGGSPLELTQRSGQAAPAVVPDGADGVILVWGEWDATLSGVQIVAQRLSAAGAAQWPAGQSPTPVALSAPRGDPVAVRAVADGRGGAFAFWSDSQEIRGAHLDQDGRLGAPAP